MTIFNKLHSAMSVCVGLFPTTVGNVKVHSAESLAVEVTLNKSLFKRTNNCHR